MGRGKPLLVLLLIAPILFASACASGTTTATSGRQGVTSTSEVASTSEPRSASPITAAPAATSRDNPVAAGQDAQVGDWKIRVIHLTPNATKLSLNDRVPYGEPKPGNRFVIVTIEATYTGNGSSTFWRDMVDAYVGSEGDTFVGPEEFAVPPHPIVTSGAVLPGETISGDLLYSVPSNQVEGGTLMIYPSSPGAKNRGFFAVQ